MLAIWDILRLNRDFLSVEEITELINLNKDKDNPEDITVSKSFVYRYLTALEEGGYLARKLQGKGTGRREFLFRLKKNTGANPPLILTRTVIYDPNEKCLYFEEIDYVTRSLEKQGKRIVRKEVIDRGDR